MAVSYVNSGQNFGTGTAITIPKPVGIQTGDAVVVQVVSDSTPSISDNNGSAPFSVDASYTHYANAARTFILSRIAGSQEPSAFSFTLSAANSWAAVVSIYRGVDASIWRIGPSGHFSTSFNTVPSSPIISSGLISGDMLIGVYSGDTNYNSLASTPSGYTARQHTCGSREASFVDKLVTSTSQSSAVWTLSCSTSWAAGLFAIKQGNTFDTKPFFYAQYLKCFGGV